MLVLAADVDIWRFQPHPEVWLLIAAIIGFGWWVARVLGPKAVPPGQPVVSKLQAGCFTAAVLLLWTASDWPMHDLSEEYSYAVHMVQHMLITMVIPPLFLLATPQWLARLIVSEDGTSGVWVRRMTRPIVAALVFNVLVGLTHIAWVVNTSVQNGILHYFVHLCVFTAALLMWMPVVSPLPELRASYPGRMMFLFLNSVVPTVPGAFLTFAEEPVYSVYDHPVRLWGISAVDDQQAAGLIMKLGGGFLIWTIIIFLFFTWVSRQESLRPDSNGSQPPVLTFDEVQTAFDRAGEPAPDSSS